MRHNSAFRFAVVAMMRAGLLALACISGSSGLQLGVVRLGAREPRVYPLRMTDSYDTNEVVVAARKGKVDMLAALLVDDSAAANVPVKCEKIPTMDGATSIIWAARQGRFEAVQLLISNKADVNAAAQSGWTALYAEALNGHETIVALLVNNGASVESAMRIGDERTNLNLQRMLDAADLDSATPPDLQQQPMKSTAAFPPPAPPMVAAPPPSPSPPAPLRQADATALDAPTNLPADSPADFKVVARAEIAAPLASDGALAGMGELEAMKLRLEWRAPPSPEEQESADRARQTVFKYRHDRIKELEAIVAYGQPRAASAPATPAPAASVPAVASFAATAATAAPVAATMIGGAAVVDASALAAKIDALEAKINAMSGGFEAGYAKGFAEGFVAGRKETIR